MKNKAVEKAYLEYKQGETLVEEQKTADRRVYWYVFALSLAVLFHIIEPLLSLATWIKAWL